MTIAVRRSADRLHTNIGWLNSRHSFSFAEHYDPRYMGFRSLRVLNEDWIAPAQGFGTHAHRDIEIVTIVLDGALQHQDSLGTGSVMKPGDVQRITAGTGILHSEFNASDITPLHLIQIWIAPAKKRLRPGYEHRSFGHGERTGGLRLIVSPDGRDGSVTIHQDASIFRSQLGAGEAVSHQLAAGRHAWIQVVRGSARINGATTFDAGDGADVADEPHVTVESTTATELLLFDLA